MERIHMIEEFTNEQHGLTDTFINDVAREAKEIADNISELIR
jgi:hypothetical protein